MGKCIRRRKRLYKSDPRGLRFDFGSSSSFPKPLTQYRPCARCHPQKSRIFLYYCKTTCKVVVVGQDSLLHNLICVGGSKESLSDLTTPELICQGGPPSDFCGPDHMVSTLRRRVLNALAAKYRKMIVKPLVIRIHLVDSNRGY
jgi:hypothetical protein